MKRADRMRNMTEQIYNILKNLEPTQFNENEIRRYLICIATGYQIPHHYYDSKGRMKRGSY